MSSRTKKFFNKGALGVAKVSIKDGKLMYKKMFKQYEMPMDSIVWAYLQQEDVQAKMCCGRPSFPIGRLIVQDGEGKREIFQYDGMDEPRRLLNEIQQANSSIAIGYTQENRARFGA